jgi:long-chain acyl-CoA synthetase
MRITPADIIQPDSAETLDGLFQERVRRSPESIAYRYYDNDKNAWGDLTWSDMEREIRRWQAALLQENLAPGDRVAVMLRNCPQWVMFDQAALGLGLVTVPLYTSDRPENVVHVLQDSGARLLLIESPEHWLPLRNVCETLTQLTRIVTLQPLSPNDTYQKLQSLDQWLPASGDVFHHRVTDSGALATIVYTSGTTGKPKGVMLSHSNLLDNCWQAIKLFRLQNDECMLSFLPLSHALERMAGYYLAVMGGVTVAYARSIQQLQEDFNLLRPTILISVPRIFERILGGIRKKLEKEPAAAGRLFDLTIDTGYKRFEYQQKRAAWDSQLLLWPLLERIVARKITQKLGGKLRLIVCGGAAVPAEISRTFIGLGLPFLQGYGLTESSPVISVNRPEDNLPASVGPALEDVETRVDENGVLYVRGPNVMLGYWNNPSATAAVLDGDGWLNTGDAVRIDANGHIHITGRLKEILVLSNGEKIPPGDIETAILQDPLFEQVMVTGEGKPYLSLLAVINRDKWLEAAEAHHFSKNWPECLDTPQAKAYALTCIGRRMQAFPGYARVRRVVLLSEAWSVENGLLTPTLKLKRSQVLERYGKEYQALYQGYMQ